MQTGETLAPVPLHSPCLRTGPFALRTLMLQPSDHAKVVATHPEQFRAHNRSAAKMTGQDCAAEAPLDDLDALLAAQMQEMEQGIEEPPVRSALL